MRRRTRLLVAAPLVSLAALAATSACAPFHAGAAATVGDSRISTDQLRSTTERVLAAQPADATAGNATQDVVQQQALSQLVSLAVLDQLAPGGVTLTAAEVADGRSAVLQALTQGQQTTEDVTALAAAKGYDLDAQARLVATIDAVGRQTVSAADVTATYDAEVDHHVYQVEEFLIPSTIDVSKVRALIAQPQGLATLEQQLPQVGGQVATATVDGQTLASALKQNPGLTGYKTGSVIGQLAQSGGTVLLVATGSRNRTLDEALAEGSTEREQALITQYAAAEKKLGVHVNPRFGAWNPTGMSLVGLPLGAVGAGAVQLSTALANSAAGNGSANGTDPSATTSATTGG